MGVLVRGKAGSGVLGRLRTERFAYLRKNWLRALVLVVGYALASFVVLSVGWITLASSPQFRSAVVALVAGALLVGGMWFWWWFLTLDDSHYKRRGAWAEQWTSDEVKRLPLDGHWVLQNRIDFDGFDVDHVLIGPIGLFVIETKWRAKRRGRYIPTTRHALRSELAQTQAAAEAVRERLAAGDVHVTPRQLLVLWGPGFNDIPRGATRIGDTWVLRGFQRKEWPIHSIFVRFAQPIPGDVLRCLIRESP